MLGDKIGLCATVKLFHLYLEDGSALPLDLLHMRISPWLWFSCHYYSPDVVMCCTNEHNVLHLLTCQEFSYNKEQHLESQFEAYLAYWIPVLTGMTGLHNPVKPYCFDEVAV